MSNLLFTAYAYDKQKNGSANVLNDSSIDVYLQNAFVCLKSAKIHNPDDDVMLLMNIDLPEKYDVLFKGNSILVKKMEFDHFNFPDEVKWGLAFFKLCALYHAINDFSYKKIAMFDTDTYIINSFNDLWTEADTHILIYNIFHWISNENEKTMQNEINSLAGYEIGTVTHYGGEFICSTTELLNQYITLCLDEAERMVKMNQYTTRGDEYIVSIAAYWLKEIVKSANAYCQRCWTSNGFYYCSTNMYCSPVAILHLPDEKKRGLLRLYNYYIKKRRFPTYMQTYKMLRLPNKRHSIISDLKDITIKLIRVIYRLIE